MDTWVEAVLVFEYDLGLDKNLSDSDSNLWAKLLWVGLRENVLELRLHLTFLLVGAHTQYTDMEKDSTGLCTALQRSTDR